MHLTVCQKAKLTEKETEILRELSHTAKNLYNEALYLIRQHFFATGKLMGYCDVYRSLKESENYRALNSNMAQQILKRADNAFSSFSSLLSLKAAGKYEEKVHLPRYLEKDGFTSLVIGFVRIRDMRLLIPYSVSFRKTHQNIEIAVPPVLSGRNVKEIRIVPKENGRSFEFQYIYEKECSETLRPDFGKAMAVDLGVSNLASCVTSEGKAFLIDGRCLKSVNQWANKNNARLQGIKDRQGLAAATRQQKRIWEKRNRRIRDYVHKAAGYITGYCTENGIGTLVLGINGDFQKSPHMGRRNNQSFVNIPFGKLKDCLEYRCALAGIRLILQEESYTSKASFFDGDEIPVYGKENENSCRFSGRRVKRGLYETAGGRLLNADINAALNILKKSNAVDLSILSSRGEASWPLRIRLT